ncbi:unnamed protein product [Notodromas monacha]|uniref:RING-type E3 ubiquitin transferase n=1 Tax=Notodromas monacha TaxID=399045 RepID=A0A7R9BQ98_9CRUS|nr:unnamed protein product [Notodromas monacha]CAG0918587.1 unnamed protein product [Notodromas monacha]
MDEVVIVEELNPAAEVLDFLAEDALPVEIPAQDDAVNVNDSIPAEQPGSAIAFSPVVVQDAFPLEKTPTMPSPLFSSSRRSLKRPRLLEEDSVAEPDSCVICFEPYTSMGPHRLVSLKCGHIFGDICVRKCLEQHRKCPQCNSKAKLSDIRILYASALIAMDNSEVENLKGQAENLVRMLKEKDIVINQYELQMICYRDRISRLEKENEMLRVQRVRDDQPVSIQVSSRIGAKCVDTCELSKTGTCRVLAYSSGGTHGVVSMSHPSSLFTNLKFGLKKFKAGGMKSADFIGLHGKEIRDVAFAPDDEDLVLTVSLDQAVKIYDVRTKNAVNSAGEDQPIWACCWNPVQPKLLYVGLQNGIVRQYDVRKFDEVCETVCATKGPGVVSLAYALPDTRDNLFPSGGLLVGTLKTVLFYNNANRGTVVVPAGADSFTYVEFENQTRHALLSKRACATSPYAKHCVGQISQKMAEGGLSCTFGTVTSIRGAKDSGKLCRSLMFGNPFNREAAVVVADFDGSSAGMYDAGSGRSLQRIPTKAPVLDAKKFTVGESHYMALLTAHGLSVQELSVCN